MKIQYSNSLILVWRIAEIEARHLKSPDLEPPHLLLGLCKAVDLDLPEFVSKDIPNRDEVLEELLHEVRRIKNVFRAAMLDARTFRRRLRQSIADPQLALSNPDRLHRSKAAKKVFTDAERLAALEDSNVFPAHLLYAVLLGKDDKLDKIFEELGLSRDDFEGAAKREALFHGRPNAIMSGKGRSHRN